MTTYDFLDEVCGEIKYKTIHMEIKEELRAHIEESVQERMKDGTDSQEAMSIAVERMGEPKETGRLLNDRYKMPFNSSFGLVIWGAAVTMIIYFVYPIISKLGDGTLGIRRYNYIFITMGILLFAFANVIYLRRGMKIIALRDMGQIVLGFFIGWAVSAAFLVGTSYLSMPMHYLYFNDVPLPVSPAYIPLLPKNYTVFGLEYFTVWLCLMIYMLSTRSRRKIRKGFPFYTFTIYDGKMIEDFDDFAEGREKNGKRLVDASLVMFGLHLDKYGEKSGKIQKDKEKIY